MNVQEYTAQNLGEQLVLAELHLTDYLRETGGIPVGIEVDTLPQSQAGAKDKEFCVECLTKHALAISGFAKEGVQFFPGHPLFPQVSEVATQLYQSTPDMSREVASKMFNLLRTLRKQLTAQHLILDNAPPTTTQHFPTNHIK